MQRTASALGLVITLAMTGACKDEGTDAKADDGKTKAAQSKDGSKDDGEPKDGDAETKGDAKPKGGLLSATKEVIADARGSAVAPIRLIPERVEFLVQLRPQALLANSGASDLWKQVEGASPELGKGLDIVRTCLGGLDKFEEVALGFDDEDHAVAAIHAEKIGTEETWRCFEKEATTQGSNFDLSITGTPVGKGWQLASADGDHGYFVDDDTMVMVSSTWDEETTALIDGKGKPAHEGKLAPTVGRIDREHPLWIAGVIEGKVASDLSAMGGMYGSNPLGTIRDVAFSVRMEGNDVAFSLSADMGDPPDAIRARDELQKKYDEFKAMLPMIGLTGSFIEKIHFEAEGDVVSLDFVLTQSDIAAIRSGMRGVF